MDTDITQVQTYTHARTDIHTGTDIHTCKDRHTHRVRYTHNRDRSIHTRSGTHMYTHRDTETYTYCCSSFRISVSFFN